MGGNPPPQGWARLGEARSPDFAGPGKKTGEVPRVPTGGGLVSGGASQLWRVVCESKVRPSFSYITHRGPSSLHLQALLYDTYRPCFSPYTGTSSFRIQALLNYTYRPLFITHRLFSITHIGTSFSTHTDPSLLHMQTLLYYTCRPFFITHTGPFLDTGPTKAIEPYIE